jgi:dTDP-4-amino-4,6-dideoxygalactose transaminase
LYVVQAEDRDALKVFLGDHGIETGLHYPLPLHRQQAYASLGYKPQDFPVTNALAGRILSLPMFPTITREQVEYVCSAVMEFKACPTVKV